MVCVDYLRFFLDSNNACWNYSLNLSIYQLLGDTVCQLTLRNLNMTVLKQSFLRMFWVVFWFQVRTLCRSHWSKQFDLEFAWDSFSKSLAHPIYLFHFSTPQSLDFLSILFIKQHPISKYLHLYFLFTRHFFLLFYLHQNAVIHLILQ